MRERDDVRRRYRSHLLRVLAVAVLVAASGCGALGAAPGAGGELPSRQEAADRYASLDTVSATVTTVQERNDTTTTTVTRKRQRLEPWAYRSRVLSVNRSEDARPPLVSEGGFVVVNETTFTYYDPASERLSRAEIEGSDGSDESPYLRFVAAAKTGDSVARPTATPGIPSLPQIPVDGSDGNGSASYREGTVTVAYAGTETVDGREAYRLELTPSAPNMSLQSETVWLDSEYLYPLKWHTEFVAYGTDYEYTTTYRNVTFNPTFESGIFRVDPEEVPDGVREVRSDNYDSASAMAEAIDLPVPDPSVPERFELESASYQSTDPEFASLRYERPDSEAVIRLFVFGDTSDVTSGTPVQIGSHEARRLRTNGTTTISWTADGHTYQVSGTVGNDTLVGVARSVAKSV
jgi:outer membrane lipoprotein-sorting protein